MGTPCNCCGGSTEPREACDTSSEIIPPHPSAPSTRILTAGQTFTTETLAVGCTVSGAIGPSTVGRHALEISVTSQQPLWHGFLIAWLAHADLPLDPFRVGSLESLAAGAALKISDVSGWDLSERPLPVDQRSGPWLLPTLVVEQDGKLYLAYRRRLLDLTLAAPCCWRGLSATAIDAGECDRWTRSVFAVDRSSASESVVAGNGLQSSDWFGRLKPDGTLDRDDRPNFDLDTSSHALTRVGFALGLSSCPWEVAQENRSGEGTFTLKGLLGPICGSITAYGSYRTAGTAQTPEPPGTLLIDEPLGTLPLGWQTGDLAVDDTPLEGGPEGSHFGAVFTVRDGATFVENVGLSEYPSGTLFTEIPMARTEWVDGSRLTVEFNWHRVRNADRRYALPGTPAPHEYRNQTCGLFIGGLLRFLLRHENAARYDELLSGNSGILQRYGWIAEPCHPYGGKLVSDLDYAAWPGEWAFDPDLLPPGRPWPVLPQAGAFQAAGEPAFDARGVRAPMAANDGDHVALVLTCSRPTIANPYTARTDDTLTDWVWRPEIWINGRRISGLTASNSGVLTSYRAVPPLTTLRIGLAAYYGGGWSNLRVWRTP